MPLTTWLYRDFNSTVGFEPTNDYVNALPLSYILQYGRSRTSES